MQIFVITVPWPTHSTIMQRAQKAALACHCPGGLWGTKAPFLNGPHFATSWFQLPLCHGSPCIQLWHCGSCSIWAPRANSIHVPTSPENLPLLKVTMTLATENCYPSKRCWRYGDILLEGQIADYKNLEYPKNAKGVNPCQARWTIFYSNLSPRHQKQQGQCPLPLTQLHQQACIAWTQLPSNIVVAPVCWEKLQWAQAIEPSYQSGTFPQPCNPTECTLH